MTRPLTVSLTNADGSLRAWDEITRDIIRAVYRYRSGNVMRIAEEMGEHRRTMQRRFHRLELGGRGLPGKRRRSRGEQNLHSLETPR